MSFPTFRNTEQFQNNPQSHLYTGQNNPVVPMSLEGTLAKTAFSFGVLLLGAIAGWVVPVLMLPALLAGFILGLVIAIKRIKNPVATLSYSALQGIVVGGISGFLETLYPGIVLQAVGATLSVFAVVLVLYRLNIYRQTPLMNKIFIAASLGYLLFGLVNLGLMIFNVTPGMFGLYSDLGPWGILIGILGAALASYSLVMDFTFVENGIHNRIESKWEWLAAFSLIGTIVWLYVEILRIIALFRN